MRLVRQRGLCMQEAVPVGAGAMAAVLGAEVAAVERACVEAGGVVEAVNYNCPGQLVIAGEKAAVERAGERIAQSGRQGTRVAGERAVPLPPDEAGRGRVPRAS